MKKHSLSSENKLGYNEDYQEIIKYKISSNNQSNMSLLLEKNFSSMDISLSKTTRWLLFVIFIFLQILMNIDHGTFPAATDEIRKDLSIDDNILGIFGSLVFFGNLIGKVYLFIRFIYFNLPH